MAIALDGFEAAKRGLAPFEPLIEAECVPDTLEMGLSILDAIFAFQEAHERLIRLCDAVASPASRTASCAMPKRP
jgi:hypothetical protein